MQIEILALRHQLAVLQRRTNKRASLRTADRLLWVMLSRLWGQWRSTLVIVKPETVIAWHRKGFRLYWRWKSRADSELSHLICLYCRGPPSTSRHSLQRDGPSHCRMDGPTDR
jgi:hypothetical protein